MAKTIRSHPTSPFILPEQLLLDYSYIFKIWTKNGPTFSSFSNLPTSKKTTPPKEKTMRMDHPFILGFCQNLIFDMVFTIFFRCFRKNLLS